MPNDNTVRGNRELNSASSEINALDFFVRTKLINTINTCEVVKVVTVYANGSGGTTGYVDVEPLVSQLDAYGNALPQVPLYHLPFSRVQGGIAAIVIDPTPGDLGFAVYTKYDSTNVKEEQEETVPPGSYRLFDRANGIYVPGILNKAPEIFLELDQENRATLTAPESVTINTKNLTINADEDVRINCNRFNVYARGYSGINAPSWGFDTWDGTGTGTGTMRANITQIGTWSRTGALTQNGNITQTGSISSTGDHVAGSISLNGHRHGGVETGGGTTGGPV